MKLTVSRAGPSTTVQDLGRFGFRDIGVSSGGALDPHAARVANLLAGNPEGAALLEVTLGGGRLRFHDERVIAWCGGAFKVSVGTAAVPAGRAALVRPNEEMNIGYAERGCRAWLAISGGVDVPLMLGSHSTDLRAAFGGFEGRRLRDGDVVPLAAPGSGVVARVANWGAPGEWSNTAARVPVLRVLRGANWSEFAHPTQAAFLSDMFAVTGDSDRMGARLEGSTLRRATQRDLLSEAVTPGTIQVPPEGNPIVLLGDCQTIGGYPRIAHVITVDLGVAAQLRAGDRVTFREVTMGEAHRLLLAREEELQRFRIGVTLRTQM